MPTERLYRLPEKKWQIIRDAAIKEFARVPFEKVSINKIIQNANISRGSFYTYFEDKQDVLNFIFEDVHDRCNLFIMDALVKNGGDFFDTMAQLFDFCVELFQNKEILELSKNVFSFYQGSQAFFGIDKPTDEKQLEQAKRVLRFMDTESFRNQDAEDFVILSSISLANMVMNLVNFYQGQSDQEVLRKRYLKGLELLKYGALSTDTGSLNR